MEKQDFSQIYNNLVSNKYAGEYEKNRWFTSKIKQAGYVMTLKSIIRHFLLTNNLNQASYLELGPGPGTWTKLILKNKPAWQADLVEISREMLDQAKKALADYSSIIFYNLDFLNYQPAKQYDILFSSRVIEYIDDKQALVKKISQSLKSGGQGFIITKVPKYWRYKLMGQKVAKMHTGQISPRQFKVLLKQSGFIKIKIYPVTFSFPFFKSAWLNKVLFFKFGRFPLNFISQFFAESYAIKFIKS